MPFNPAYLMLVPGILSILAGILLSVHLATLSDLKPKKRDEPGPQNENDRYFTGLRDEVQHGLIDPPGLHVTTDVGPSLIPPAGEQLAATPELKDAIYKAPEAQDNFPPSEPTPLPFSRPRPRMLPNGIRVGQEHMMIFDGGGQWRVLKGRDLDVAILQRFSFLPHEWELYKADLTLEQMDAEMERSEEWEGMDNPLVLSGPFGTWRLYRRRQGEI